MTMTRSADTMIIPWRAGDAHRERLMALCAPALTKVFAYSTFVLADDPSDGPFSRGRAINAAVADMNDAALMIVCDADSLCTPRAWHTAVMLASQHDRLVLPYTHYAPLDEETTEPVLLGADPFAATPGETSCWSTGGAMVMRVGAFREVGGFDERFVGWGFEDTALRNACDTLLGPSLRITGPLVHLWHESALRLNEHYDAGHYLALDYDKASGDVGAMRTLIEGQW